MSIVDDRIGCRKYRIVITLDTPCEVMYGMDRRSDRSPDKIEVRFETETDMKQVFNHIMKLIDAGENAIYLNRKYIMTNHIVMIEKVIE